MSRTEQSESRTGHEQDRTSRISRTAFAETLELEDMAQAFGARIPASVAPFHISFSAHGGAQRPLI
jgi:hypothetical protein